MNRLICIVLLGLFISAGVSGYDWIPGRRKEQNPTETGYLIAPLPYSLPGIGSGITFLGNVSNIGGSTFDLSGLIVTGDAEGYFLLGDELPVFSENLMLEFNFMTINRASVNQYEFRGMDNSGRYDFTINDLTLVKNTIPTFHLTFYERRLTFNYTYAKSSLRIAAIRDNNGDLIAKLPKPFEASSKTNPFGFSVDFTDDYFDPRRGFRFDAQYVNHPAVNSDAPDFFTIDLNMVYAIPVGKKNTVVLNYLKSDAFVRSKGNTNPDDIMIELGFDPFDPADVAASADYVNNVINERTHGTASGLGGDSRLRSYPAGRYSGAHTAFLAAEYRWNITQESTPFNYFIWKDVRSGLQVAFFAEFGSVAEHSSEVWKEYRHSVGTGFRLVTKSGSVYRFDYAYGSEGGELTIMFQYPW